ncbi:hypothetical protein VB715_11760 [Crocosphaera sp. UHCC 0190]|uniref:hypothetical protein n=1 Tax=Crocosphaera sp. UHCC 0190 TaxID=3110246 RepID=UPI002B1F6E1B|nr:hypothetical protein [Crocosphaera sp. UHCC 0190]MEA5510442.1 hypothetical protein [Crocosphaera sp. UHCC 0190]
MPTVYLKDGTTVQVRLEDLEDYLYDNQDQIETRPRKLRRPPVDTSVMSVSNK